MILKTSSGILRGKKVVKQQYIPRTDHLCYDIENKRWNMACKKVVKQQYIPRTDQLCYDIENLQVKY